MISDGDIKAESSEAPVSAEELQNDQHQKKKVRIAPSLARTVMPTEDKEVPRGMCTSSRPEELTSPNSAVRESTRLRNKAANSSKARQGAQEAQLDTETQSGFPSHSSYQHSNDRHTKPSSAQTDSAQTDRVMAAAQAAQQVKHACTIDEAELLALRPTLLKGYASLQDNSRSEILEAQLKSVLYYFRHHTVEPEILKRLYFVEIVYMLQNHANRLVADLAAQLVSLGPWKVVYDQLRVVNAAWFEQHAINAPEAVQLAGTGTVAAASVVPVAAALQKQGSGL
ncbi:TPA: hypothetical protein ACH3X2_004268 [Trebouxia sp. C0005]